MRTRTTLQAVLRSVVPLLFCALALSGCPDPDPMRPDAPRIDGGPPDAPPVDAPIPDVPDDSPDLRSSLLDALGTSVWSAVHTRHEPDHVPTPILPDGGFPDGGVDPRNFVERAYELHFDADALAWVEIRNPYGPARRRRFRVFSVDRDGRTVTSAVVTPAGWPTDPSEGRSDTWTFEVTDGTPRELHVTNARGEEEVFVEGPTAPPTGGLTAAVRFFVDGDPVDVAACDTAAIGDAERRVLLDFARGAGANAPHLGHVEVVGGVPLEHFAGPGATPFSDLTDFDRLGGPVLPTPPTTTPPTPPIDPARFVAHFSGTVAHAGGNLRLRELDDELGSGLMAFLDAEVGSTTVPADLFLEVLSATSTDGTGDTAQRNLAAGAIPIELVLWRCGGGADVDVELDVGAGFLPITTDVATPALGDVLFPPAL